MYNVDYNMAEYTSDYIYKKLVDGNSVPNDILENFMTSIAYLTIHKESLGPKAMLLQDYLNALYSYDHINRLEKFDLGVVYGTTTFFKKMMDIKEGVVT